MKFQTNPTADWLLQFGINTEVGITCRLKCPGCARSVYPKLVLANRSIFRFDEYKPILDVTDHYKFCGNHSDPIYHPDFVKTFKYLNDQNKHLTVSTNGSGKTKEWWVHVFSLSKETTEFEFALDGIPEDSHIYRINQDGNHVWEIMKLGRSMGVNIIWQYIIFDYNKDDVEFCRDMANYYGMTFIEEQDRHGGKENPHEN